jgi:hypothetical protein
MSMEIVFMGEVYHSHDRMVILILKKSGKNFGEGDGRGARGGETPRGRRREEGPPQMRLHYF